ncbi:MAG TPA: 1,4-alpha-glucan branching protein GlgB [bacterium]|nr:1,4-alpha-glucan branching protein GlgB [bacterium]HOL34833.1 1,4-alpha-glucan branching protein GlgB [bacterium]HPP07910.1 1,4-alpha-glucan branching protein GlgB [bacterium]
MDKRLLELLNAEYHNPHEILSWQQSEDKFILRIFVPDAKRISVINVDTSKKYDLIAIEGGIFEGLFDEKFQYRIEAEFFDGTTSSFLDPYAFNTSIFGEMDLYLFNEGNHFEIFKKMGAVYRTINGISGYNFSVWAPDARRVSVVGDFNRWDGRMHQMRVLGTSGVWEIFIPELKPGALYKYEILTRERSLILKSDPYGTYFERRPHTASITWKSNYTWQDEEFIKQPIDFLNQPLSIYEVHLGSWKRKNDGSFYNYRELAPQIVDHVKSLNFNCIELLPVAEHPFDASWGYQATGFYAPTSRYGNPDDFKFFVDYCHKNNIHIILDWTPAHFPKDSHGLYLFDGTHLYEHQDPRKGEHPDWKSAIFNYGRYEVSNFLIGSALNWIDNYHIDGLRVDAVASMLYLDYSRKDGEWIPNIYGGRENLEAIDFVKKFNTVIYGKHQHSFTVAEESTAWPGVTKPVYLGGLGFGFKWNLGWMHDSLSFFSKDPIYRKFHLNSLTFSLLYAFSENYILPLSHDEMVYGKRSLIGKMPGDTWQKFANLRLLYGWQFGHPGKKLLFMSGEFGQWNEWNHAGQLDWELLNYENHRGIFNLIKDLNVLYLKSPEMYENESSYECFQWIDFSDVDNTIVSFLRWNRKKDNHLVFVFNFTPVVRHQYRIGVPFSGKYKEILNSDSILYWGSNTGNLGFVQSEKKSMHHFDHSIEIVLPPLGFVVFAPMRGD